MSDEPKLFLLGQTFSELVVEHSADLLAILCDEPVSRPNGDEAAKEEWIEYPRSTLMSDAAKQNAPRRVALVTSAGRGKSTNMTFAEAHIANEAGSKQVPFLFRLDRTSEHTEASHINALAEAVKNPDSLLDTLALRVKLAVGGDLSRHRWALERYAAADRVTLLFDGLDHVMDRDAFVRGLANLLNAPPWCGCPVWISGRREAFKKWGEAFFAGFPLHILQVDPLARPEIGFYMKTKTGHRWEDDFPPECRPLLATPRTLGLLGYVLRTQIPLPPPDKQARQEKIRALELHTAAGIYHHAYFHVGLPNDPNSHGLLAQGLLADLATFGLRGRTPLAGNLLDRVERMGLVLGAIAFHMLAEGVEGIRLHALNHQVGAKLERMRLGTAGDFEEDLELLRAMDNHTLEFSLFNSDWSTGEISWDNRTARAFFAAYWATRHASFDEDLPNLKNWIVGKDDKRLTAFDEFWQFAAEMPGRALQTGDELSEVDTKRWMHIFGLCYTPPAQVTGEHEWVQWHRRMIYHSFPLMRTRSQGTIDSWRARTADQAAILQEIDAGWCDIAAGPCHYGAEPAENRNGRVIQVPAFRMHEWPVINRWYDGFDTAHRADQEIKFGQHPLAGIEGPIGEDHCPAVFVTWYDAWCFATWCGDHVYLPTQLEWEHACRKGTAWNYFFGDDENTLTDHAWFNRNAQNQTHPMPRQHSSVHCNANKLYDMHGHILEWCFDEVTKLLPNGKEEGRVLRGGSWTFDSRVCRCASTGSHVPEFRYIDAGFRLAAHSAPSRSET